MAALTRAFKDAKRWVRNVSLSRGYLVLGAGDLSQVDEVLGRLRCRPGATPLIRLGADRDGGYLVPDDLSGLAGCISPGVSDEVSFDLALAQRGLPVLMLDASVEAPPVAHPLFTFLPRHLAVREGLGRTTLAAAAARWPTGDLLLQIDIEGAEYPVLASTPSEVMARFRIIVVELHDLHLLTSSEASKGVEAAFDVLLEHHVVTHVHANNFAPSVGSGNSTFPQVLEVTLHRRDRYVPARAPESLPHPLDRPCDPSRAETPVPAYLQPSRAT